MNNNSSNKQSLDYPKLYLSSKSPKCCDKQHCKQCYGNDNNNMKKNNGNNNGVFCLCTTLGRRSIADELFDCATQSLCKTCTTSKLFLNDRLLIESSNEYKLNDNWFSKVYSFLK